jgi:hypothetical protein
MNTYQETRAAARLFFPLWSRHMRAKWVIARLKVNGAKVGISSQWSHDALNYAFPRTGR